LVLCFSVLCRVDSFILQIFVVVSGKFSHSLSVPLILGGVELGIFSQYIGSLGFLLLLIADQIPPSFLPWLLLRALRSLFWVFAFMCSRCVISFARRASSVCQSLLVSKSLAVSVAFLFFSSDFVLAFILWVDIFSYSLAVLLISVLKVSHRVWGFVCSRPVFSLFHSAVSNCRAKPFSIIF